MRVFPLKDKNMYRSCKIYQVDCICNDDYIGEIGRNVITHWGEHNNPTLDLEPVKHLTNNLNHSFYWFIVANASSSKRTWKNLEPIYIALKKQKLMTKS